MTAPHMNAILSPGLYIVATPIGNLGDLSPRAVEILSHADVIAVEDSRVTARLLHHIGIKRPMIPYHDHNADGMRPGLVARLGTDAVALVRSEEHTSELQSLMRISYAVFCLKKKNSILLEES